MRNEREANDIFSKRVTKDFNARSMKKYRRWEIPVSLVKIKKTTQTREIFTVDAESYWKLQRPTRRREKSRSSR